MHLCIQYTRFLSGIKRSGLIYEYRIAVYFEYKYTDDNTKLHLAAKKRTVDIKSTA